MTMARPHNLRNHLSMPPEVEEKYQRWMKMHAKNPHVSYKVAWLAGYREGKKEAQHEEARWPVR